MIASSAIARERHPWRSPESCILIVPSAPRMSPMCASSSTGGTPSGRGGGASVSVVGSSSAISGHLLYSFGYVSGLRVKSRRAPVRTRPLSYD